MPPSMQPPAAPAHEHHHHYHYHYHQLPHHTQSGFSLRLPNTFRIVDPHPSQTLDSSDPPLYKSHPIYSLRRSIVLNAIVGLILAFIAYNSTPYWDATVWQYGMFGMGFSGVLAVWDVWSWVCRKMKQENLCYVCSGVCQRLTAVEVGNEGRNETDPLLDVSVDTVQSYSDAGMLPDNVADLEQGLASGNAAANLGLPTPSTSTSGTPAPPSANPNIHNPAPHPTPQRATASKPIWPSLILMIVEFLFVVGLIYLLVAEVVSAGEQLDRNYYDTLSSFFRLYATVPTFFAVVLHARCWWAEFRERERQKWKKMEPQQGRTATAAVAGGRG